MNIAVLGCGYWGKNHVRTFRNLGVLSAVCDPTPAGRALAAELAPEAAVYDSLESLLKSDSVDGVVVATPAETHVHVVRAAIEAGLDVLVEKPLALDVEHAEQLVELAEKKGRVLMVGHVLEYHPGFTTLHGLIAQGHLGAIRYIYSNRLNHGKIRREENILWSFAPHDISLILRLMGTLPVEVVATGGNYVQANIADTTVTQLLFENGVRSHIFVSWLHPYKDQRLVVVGSERMAVFDDVAKELSIYDQRVSWENGQPTATKGEVQTIPFGGAEPLRLECEEFLESIKSRQTPLTDGYSALSVLKVLSAAQRSLVLHGTPVQMPFGSTFSSVRHGTAVT